MPSESFEELAARPKGALALLYDEEAAISDRMSVEKAWHGMAVMRWDILQPVRRTR